MRRRPAPPAIARANARAPVFAAVIAAALATAGCSVSDEILFRTFAGEAPAAPGTMVSQVDAARLDAAPPGFQRGMFLPRQVTRGPAGATMGGESGRDIALARLNLMDLGTSIRRHSDRLQAVRRSYTVKARGYSAEVAELGLTAGGDVPANDDAFVRRAADIRSHLGRMQAELLKFNGLATRVEIETARGTGMAQSIRAIGRRPGMSPPERKELTILRREIDDNVDLLNRFSSELRLDIDSQTEYLSKQRRRFGALVAQIVAADPEGPLGPLGKLGPPGSAGAARTSMPAPGTADPGTATARTMAPARRPLVTIRFGSPDTDFAKPLRRAVQETLDRRPDARFEIVGVSPGEGKGPVTSSTLRHVLGVKRTLEEMGLPGARMTLSSATSPDAAGEEVRVFVRVAGMPGWRPPAAAVPMAPDKAPRTAAYHPDAASRRDLTVASFPHDPRPLVAIRFDTPDVDYAETLRKAMQAALDRRPGARFELVSIAAGRNDFAAGTAAALDRADAIMRTLAGFGLPKDRVSIEATATPEPGPDTVLIFVR